LNQHAFSFSYVQYFDGAYTFCPKVLLLRAMLMNFTKLAIIYGILERLHVSKLISGAVL